MRAVFAACRRRGIDSEARKDIQQQVTGIASMAQMDDAQLSRLLDHLNRDWQGTNPQRPHLAKIKALWWSLYWLGVIEEPGEKALSAFVKRQTGVAALRFLDSRQSFSVIEGLKQWLEREGVEWKSDTEIAALERHWPGRGRAEWDRWSVISRLHRQLYNAGLTVNSELLADRSLGLPEQSLNWTNRQLDDVIRFLGKKWRAEWPRAAKEQAE
jgi:hypothetical protein